MMSEYNRIRQETQIEEELKWLEMEQGYVQRTINSTVGKPKETLSDKGQRDSNYLPKSRTPRQDPKL